MNCERLSNPDNGVIRQNGVTVGSQASYRCNRGFVLVGTSNRICQRNGEWSADEPICRGEFMFINILQCMILFVIFLVAIICPRLRDIDNGRVRMSGFTIGSTAIYICRTGFSLMGNRGRECQEDGSWSGSEPSCRGV